MRKIIILSLMVISAFSVDAQRKRTRTATSQGNVVVRFGMGLNSDKEDAPGDPITKTTDVSFMPSIGYMVIDNLELGVDFGVKYKTTEAVTIQSPVVKDITDMTTVNFGVYAYKYFPLNNWFAFTTSAHIGLSTGTMDENHYQSSTVTNTYSASTSGVGGSINAGFGFTPYNAFALYADIAGLGVSSMKVDGNGVNDTYNYTDAGFNIHRPANLSIVWYFGRGLWKK